MIDFTELFMYLLGIVGAGLSSVLAYWVKRAADKMGIDTSEKMNERINEAVERGLGFAANRLKKNHKNLQRSTENEFVADASNYVVQGVPSLMRKFGITEHRVREMVEARLANQVPEDEDETESETVEQK